MSIRRVTFAFAASTVAALAFAAIATPAQADEGDSVSREEVERPREVLVEERFEGPRGVLVGDEEFERQRIIADDLLNHAEIDRSRFDDGHWHPRHDFVEDGPVIINQNSFIN